MAEIPTEALEAAARKLFEHDRMPDDPPWDEVYEADRDSYRNAVHAVVAAAAPHLIAEGRRQAAADILTAPASEGEARARALAEQWRQLAVNLTRCEHGRVQLDVCNGCPDRMSPDQSGRALGYSLDGTFRVVVPRRELMADPAEWYVDAR